MLNEIIEDGLKTAFNRNKAKDNNNFSRLDFNLKVEESIYKTISLKINFKKFLKETDSIFKEIETEARDNTDCCRGKNEKLINIKVEFQKKYIIIKLFILIDKDDALRLCTNNKEKVIKI